MRPTRPLSLAPRSGRAPYPPRWSASDGGVTGPHQPLQPRLKHMVCPEVSRLPGGTIAPDGLPLGPRPFEWCKTRGPNALIRG
jgi:hypothetical protein